MTLHVVGVKKTKYVWYNVFFLASKFVFLRRPNDKSVFRKNDFVHTQHVKTYVWIFRLNFFNISKCVKYYIQIMGAYAHGSQNSPPINKYIYISYYNRASKFLIGFWQQGLLFIKIPLLTILVNRIQLNLVAQSGYFSSWAHWKFLV
jgi:hypothetical protein